MSLLRKFKENINNEKLGILLAPSICVALCVLFLKVGLPHFLTNDDYGLNMISVGNFGEHNSAYLPFSNIIYGSFISWLNRTFADINWYGVVPIFISIVCFVTLSLFVVKRTDVYRGLMCSSLLVMLFGTEVFINCQFTHYAGFFSAVGLFFVFYCAFKPLPTRKSVAFLLNLFGVIISILGFWIRYESFLSVLPVVFVYLLVEIFVLIRNKDFFEQIKKSSIKQIFKGFMKRTWGAFLLLALIVISVFVNYKAFYENEGWRYWKEYNALRSSVLDYQLPDYESNKAKYKEIGVDRIDFQMLCNWNYADQNVFSKEKLEKINNFRLSEKNENVSLYEFFKQFLHQLFSEMISYYSLVALVFFVCLSVVCNRKAKWMLLPAVTAFLEFFYLSIRGRFIFRAYLGILVIALLFAMITYFQGKTIFVKTTLRQKAAFILALLAFMPPVSYQIFTDKISVWSSIKWQDNRFSCIQTLADDKDCLFVFETGNMIYPQSHKVLEPLPRVFHNSYILGGWTCPSPLEQYLLKEYNVEEEGVIQGLYDDNANVYYVERVESQNRFTMLDYIHHHYDENVKVENVNQFQGIDIFRFYVDEKPDKATIVNKTDISFHLTAKKDKKDNKKYIVKGFCKSNEIDPYKQNVWIKVKYKQKNKVKETLLRCSKVVLTEKNEIKNGNHDAATGFEIKISEEILQNIRQADLIISDGRGTSVSTDISEQLAIK